MASTLRPHLVGALAFYQRAFGLHSRSHPLERLSERSGRALERLNAPSESLRFQIALRQLRSDWDLLTEEAMSDDDALRLQLRVLELAGELPEAERLIRPNLNEAPLGRVFTAMLAQGASEVELRFGVPRRETIQVTHRTEAADVEEIAIPRTLETGFRGLLRYVEAAGFARIKPYLHSSERLPSDLDFAWSDPDRLTITFR